MATEYELDLSTRMTPGLALELLSRHTAGLTPTWNGKNNDYLLGPTIEVDVSEPSMNWRETIQEGFQFVPTLVIGFRFKNNTDTGVSSQLMLQATLLLLDRAEDAVLLFNSETIVLQRLGGRLTFNSAYHLWDDDALKGKFFQPIERHPLPSPLL